MRKMERESERKKKYPNHQNVSIETSPEDKTFNPTAGKMCSCPPALGLVLIDHIHKDLVCVAAFRNVVHIVPLSFIDDS